VPQGRAFLVLHSVVLQMQYCAWNVTPCSLAEISIILEESSAAIFCFEEGGGSFPRNVGRFIAGGMVSCKKGMVFLLACWELGSHWRGDVCTLVWSSHQITRRSQLCTP